LQLMDLDISNSDVPIISRGKRLLQYLKDSVNEGLTGKENDEMNLESETPVFLKRTVVDLKARSRKGPEEEREAAGLPLPVILHLPPARSVKGTCNQNEGVATTNEDVNPSSELPEGWIIELQGQLEAASAMLESIQKMVAEQQLLLQGRTRNAEVLKQEAEDKLKETKNKIQMHHQAGKIKAKTYKFVASFILGSCFAWFLCLSVCISRIVVSNSVLFCLGPLFSFQLATFIYGFFYCKEPVSTQGLDSIPGSKVTEVASACEKKRCSTVCTKSKIKDLLTPTLKVHLLNFQTACKDFIRNFVKSALMHKTRMQL